MSSTPVLGFTFLGQKSASCTLKLQWRLGDSARVTGKTEAIPVEKSASRRSPRSPFLDNCQTEAHSTSNLKHFPEDKAQMTEN